MFIKATYPDPPNIDPRECEEDLTDLLESEGFSDISFDGVDGGIDLGEPDDITLDVGCQKSSISLAAGQLPWERSEPRGWGDQAPNEQQELSHLVGRSISAAEDYCRRISEIDG